MGGLLATLLAAERPVDALVLVAPAFDLFAEGKMGVTLSRMGVHKIFPTLPKAEKGGDLVDKTAQQQNPNNDDIPMRALQELKKLNLQKRFHQVLRNHLYVLLQENTLEETYKNKWQLK